jgi:hypothetical protein
MKPTNDLFEQQVRGLYEGYEVPAPASAKDAVFKELDSANATASGSFASKSLLIAASLLTVGAIYMLTDNPSPVQDAPVVIEEVIEEVVEAPVEIDEPIVEVEAVISDPVVEAPVVIEEVAEAPVKVETPEVVVEAPVVIQVIKEVAPPVEVVTSTPVEEKKVEEKKEEVEWVLPATIKVEK